MNSVRYSTGLALFDENRAILASRDDDFAIEIPCRIYQIDMKLPEMSCLKYLFAM